jgi:hypothetical protein
MPYRPYDQSRMRFRVLVHVERLRVREEIIEVAQKLQHNPSKEGIARLDLIWELEARLTKLLDYYGDLDGTVFMSPHGHSPGIIADVAEVYLRGRKHPVRLGKIAKTIRNAGLQGNHGGLLNIDVVKLALRKDRRFEHIGLKGWFLVPDVVQDNAARQ